MGQNKGDEDGGNSRHAIPLVAGAIVTAQITMAAATYVGDELTLRGTGRKPLFQTALVSLPIRCALIILLKDSGNAALLSTQILDGVAGGLMGLVQPYLVADITFGTGRFNVLSKWLSCTAKFALQLCFLLRILHLSIFFIFLSSGSHRIGVRSRRHPLQLYWSDGSGKVWPRG